MDKPIEVQLFRQDDGSYNVAWRRPVRRASLPSISAGDADELPALPSADGGKGSGGAAAPTGDGLGESTAPGASGKSRSKAKELANA